MPNFNRISALLLACLVFSGWSNGSKEAVGTALGTKSSPVWFTVGQGILNEIYYPTADRAQVGDSQLLFVLNKADGEMGTFLEEKRSFNHQLVHPPGIPRPLIRAAAGTGDQKIAFTKEIVTDPASAVVRVRYRFKSLPPNTSIFLLHKPTADNDAAGDRGRAIVSKRTGQMAFVGWDDTLRGAYQAVLSSTPMRKTSVGVVGQTDGWQDISQTGGMVHQIAENGPADLAFTAELTPASEIEIAIGFGKSPTEALTAASAALATPFEQTSLAYDQGWQAYTAKLSQAPWLRNVSQGIRDEVLWDATVIKAHEDKLNPGAIVASLTIPNLPAGTFAFDGKATGGYHLVWPRDLFKSALALLRLGDLSTATDVLHFMTRMEHDGKMAQNTWVNGQPFWTAVQMDEEAFPVLLAYELKANGVELSSELDEFVARRLDRIRMSGGYTQEERWEETGGYSPNTIAVMAGALSRAGDADGARHMLDIALAKTVSHHGPLSSKPYFVRISSSGNPDDGHELQIGNGGPLLPEYRILDGGFLEWLRWFPNPESYFGARGAELAAVIRNTLRLYDSPAFGVAVRSSSGIPLYRRYNGDAYGVGHVGGPWPIFTLERALTEVAARPETAFKAMAAVRSLYGPGDLCPEQLSSDELPMPFAASPLVWCHAEMIELAHKAATAR